jgi:hypothetical protein
MIKLMMNNSGWQIAAYAASNVPTGQPNNQRRSTEKYDLGTSIIVHYLDLSPKNQVRYLGGHGPYQGKRNVDLTIKTELTGTYGRPGKNLSTIFINHFF